MLLSNCTIFIICLKSHVHTWRGRVADGHTADISAQVNDVTVCCLTLLHTAYFTALFLLHRSVDAMVLGIVGSQGSAPAVHFL